jgi:hypothetical protein
MRFKDRNPIIILRALGRTVARLLMTSSWEFLGGVFTGMGVGAWGFNYCKVNGIALPSWTWLAGPMLLLLGIGLTKGGRELRRREAGRSRDEPGLKGRRPR